MVAGGGRGCAMRIDAAILGTGSTCSTRIARIVRIAH